MKKLLTKKNQAQNILKRKKVLWKSNKWKKK